MAEAKNPKAAESAETAREEGDGGVVSARERFQRLTSEVQDRYQAVSDDVRDRVQAVSDDVRRGAERATSEIRRGVDTARRGAREGYDKVRDTTGQWSRDLSYYVRDNPGKALLMAAGVGFLLGLLVRRGRSDADES